MALEYYEHYWQSARDMGAEGARQRQRKIRANASFSGTWGGQGDPLGAQTPAAQNKMLEHFSSMAAGRIDDWESLIDPTVSYGANKAKLLEKGAEKPKTDVERERRAALSDAEDRARRHARETIHENFEAIESGDADDLLEDITVEFGVDFIEETLEAERIERQTAVEGGLSANLEDTKPTDEPVTDEPDKPEDTHPDAVDTTEPDETPTPETPVEPDETPTPETPTELDEEQTPETPAEPTTGKVSSSDGSPETATKEASSGKPDYSGVFGTLWLIYHWLLASYKQGRQEATEQPAKQSKITDY